MSKYKRPAFFIPKNECQTPYEIISSIKFLYPYKYVSQFASNKVVIDIGSGSGFGLFEVSKKAYLAAGIDILREAIEYSHTKYGKSCQFIMADAFNFPFKDAPTWLYVLILSNT
jgi:ubiquinone/menaquinone biosynthesis C-methylase UbiE